MVKLLYSWRHHISTTITHCGSHWLNLWRMWRVTMSCGRLKERYVHLIIILCKWVWRQFVTWIFMCIKPSMFWFFIIFVAVKFSFLNFPSKLHKYLWYCIVLCRYAYFYICWHQFFLIQVTDMPIYNRYPLHLWNRVGGAQTCLKFVYELYLQQKYN